MSRPRPFTRTGRRHRAPLHTRPRIWLRTRPRTPVRMRIRAHGACLLDLSLPLLSGWAVQQAAMLLDPHAALLRLFASSAAAFVVHVLVHVAVWHARHRRAQRAAPLR